MSTKLNPPQIEASLPPIVITPGTPDTEPDTVDCEFTIPLYSNPAVSLGDISGLKILIKSVSNDNLILQVARTKTDIWQFGQKITVQIKHQYSKLLIIGQYYKIQIAYLYKDENNTNNDNTTNNDNIHNDDQTDEENPLLVGYYSSVGISKCTGRPHLQIEGLLNENDFTYSNMVNPMQPFVGQYINSFDPPEKVYSYCFTLFDAIEKDNTVVKGAIVETSGVILHNINIDNIGSESSDTWKLQHMLITEKAYIIEYTVTTISGLTQSVQYKLRPKMRSFPELSPGFTTNFEIENSIEDGCILLIIQHTPENPSNNVKYIITRASNENQFKDQKKIQEFTMSLQDKLLFKDYFIQQGVLYKYKLYYEKNDQLYKIYDIECLADFEDMFLSDGERQLCVRFNPKVSSFKSTILESKMDTLGGKYPFIFRNGNVNYKEFPISGLISMTMDPDSQFIQLSDTISVATRSKTAGNLADGTDSLANLTSNNFYKERIFKTEVLKWLTNGKPKVFRSPAEGNFIVRLMNVSLTPNDTLGRMLHTFNCTAYEIAEYNFENLEKYNLMPAITM